MTSFPQKVWKSQTVTSRTDRYCNFVRLVLIFRRNFLPRYGHFRRERQGTTFRNAGKNVRSIHDYAKIFLPIAVVVIVVLAAIMYLMSPGIGDTVRPSIELNDAVYDHMLTQEKRTANEIAFYKCDGYYWVKILAEPRAYPPSNLEDDVNQYRLTVRENSDGSRQIETLPLPSKENDIPCKTS